ncbi:MBL fold metallo-hydrolase [Patulibacter defluvii]|uniref:MBL fold metallo-hydrolase n=1 Tax=Patulibacter defluvii TaxID=3095358 RepID=UPI002A75DCDC|nr:MBL fold metallo-hydrolase [Patulibacter sp. DM4]
MSTAAEPAVVEEVAPSVVRIAMPVPGLADGVNVHLIRGDGPLTLVDAATPMPGSLEALTAALDQVGVRLEQVEQLLLTHHHFDHVGLASQIAAHSGARIVALPAVGEVIADPAGHFGRELAWGERHVVRHATPDELLDGSRRALRFMGGLPGVALDRPLADGDELAAGDLRLTAHERPGHSPTDVVLVDQAAGVAFVGDHLFHNAPLAPVLGALFPPGMRPAAVYLEGLERTAALDGVRLLPGHGPPLDDPAAAVGERRASLERRIDRTAAGLGDEPTTTWGLGERVWRSPSRGRLALARLSLLLGALELLETRGLAERIDGDGDEPVRWRRAA